MAAGKAGGGSMPSGGAAGGGPAPSSSSESQQVQLARQLREEHGSRVQGELQRRLQGAESRATMAEEQLGQLQAYMAKASVRSIGRLVGLLDGGWLVVGRVTGWV